MREQQQLQQQQQKEKNFDSDRLASARRRLQESYKEAENGLLLCFYSLYCVVHVSLPRKPSGATDAHTIGQ